MDIHTATLVTKKGRVYISMQETRGGHNWLTIYRFLPPTDTVGTHEYIHESCNLDMAPEGISGYQILRKLSHAEIILLQEQSKKRLMNLSEMDEKTADVLQDTIQHFMSDEPF